MNSPVVLRLTEHIKQDFFEINISYKRTKIEIRSSSPLFTLIGILDGIMSREDVTRYAGEIF